MKFYLGVTDNHWFNYLSLIKPEDVNFWQPGGSSSFRVLSPGEPFFFKLKAPRNVIGGVGFFASHTTLPIRTAWDFFSTRNGTPDFQSFLRVIQHYRKSSDPNPSIGCIVLTDPIFFDEEDWIDVSPFWAKGIMQGKSFSTSESLGQSIWERAKVLIQKYLEPRSQSENKDAFIIAEPESPLYGISLFKKVRLGQGPFRVLVTDAYTRRCAITGEKTLPVLEAAHIKAYSSSGPHATSNGLLLRADMHKLFDNGYITITNDSRVEVSPRIKEEFQNGREYYQFHGKELLVLPDRPLDRPAAEYIDWHNSSVFRV